MADENITLHQKSLAAALEVLGVNDLAGKIYQAVFAAHTAGREEGYTEGYQTGYGTAAGEAEADAEQDEEDLEAEFRRVAKSAYSDGFDAGVAYERGEIEVIDGEFDEIGDEFTAYDSSLR